jgi:outer membrane protein OmpA-like peptidoglycan-associated protein
MGRADCIGQNSGKRSYIFDMLFCRRIMPHLFWTLILASATLRADPGDVEGSRDYVGFPRPAGYVITDYDEDNPAEFDFPVAKPLPIDADHVEAVQVKGHRYVIRYELSPGARVPSLFQTQQFYEKLASDGGYKVAKSGAVGDVTETFYRATASHVIWVYLEPAISSNVLTVVESAGTLAPPPEPPPPRLSVMPSAVVKPQTMTPPEPPPAAMVTPPVTRVPPVPTPAPAALSPPPDPNGDALFADLSASGRVIVPFVFRPGKDQLDASSQPEVDRVVAMMKAHPDLFLRIEGHTDNNGDPDDNMRLSAQRALAVQTLIMSGHIEAKRLDAVGVGGLQPLASNDTAEGREKNRRIELVMWKKYPALHPPAPNGTNYYPGGSGG